VKQRERQQTTLAEKVSLYPLCIAFGGGPRSNPQPTSFSGARCLTVRLSRLPVADSDKEMMGLLEISSISGNCKVFVRNFILVITWRSPTKNY